MIELFRAFCSLHEGVIADIKTAIFRLTATTVLITAAPLYAAEPDARSTFFTNIYVSLCMRNVNNLEALRTQLLRDHPAFPPAQATRFLNGMEGDAWPITSSLGNFAIALPKGIKACHVYAQRAPQDEVEKKFLGLVSTAPTPLVAEKRTDETKDAGINGDAHTMAYVWGIPGANRKLMFVLTTSAKEDAQVQAYATATVISE